MAEVVQLDSDQKRIRAAKAKSGLADLGWAFDEFEEKLKESWTETEASKPAKREAIYHRLKALRSLRGGLQDIVSEHEADELLTEEKRKKAEADRELEHQREQRRTARPRG